MNMAKENGANGFRSHARTQDSKTDKTPFKMPELDPGTIPAITDLPDVVDRVDYIVQLMREFRWTRGKTAKLLAKHWDLNVSTVENYSSEANHVVIANRDEASREISLVARKLLLSALANDDAKSAAAIGKLWADISGANAPIKQAIEVSGEVGPKQARDAMSAVFAGDVGKSARAPDNSLDGEPEALERIMLDLENDDSDGLA
jgi:hypothetical protein